MPTLSDILGRVWRRRPRPGGRVVAVDYDAQQIRLVAAEPHEGGVRILKLATVDIPPEVDATDAEAFGALLGDTIRRAGLGGSALAMSVPRSQAVLRPLTLPPAETEGELAAMVQYQVAKELPFPADEAVVDFTVESGYEADRHYDGESPGPEAGREAAGAKVLVAAVRTSVVEHYRRTAAAAGATLVRLGLRPYADLQAVAAYAPAAGDEAVAVVHLTPHEAEIDVLVGSALAFSRSVPLRTVTDEDEAADDLAALAPGPVQSIVTEAARSIRSYHALQPGARIAAVLVAGGAGLEAEVTARLAADLGLPCERFDPSAALGLTGEEGDTSPFISALGLAIGHAPDRTPPYDFLNPKRPPVQRDRTKLVTAAALVAAALLVGGALAAAWAFLGGKAARNQALRDEIEALKRPHAEVKALAEHVEAVEAWLATDPPWLDHWAVLSAVFPSCEQVYVTGIEGRADGTMQLSVRATDTETLDQLGMRLAEAGYSFKPGQVTTVKTEPRFPVSSPLKVDAAGEVGREIASLVPEPRPADDASADLLKAGKDWSDAPRARTASSARGGVPVSAAPEEGEGERRRGWRGGDNDDDDRGGDDEIRRRLLEKFDANRDGRLSSEEAEVARREYANDAAAWDADGDGELSSRERLRVYVAMRRLRGKG